MAYYADQAAAVADGLLHYWPLDETSGETAVDLISGLDGLVNNIGSHNADLAIADTPLAKGRDVSFFGTSQASDFLNVNYDPSAFDINTFFSEWTFRGRFYYRGAAYPAEGVSPFKIGQNGAGMTEVSIFIFNDKVSLYYESGGIDDTVALTLNTWVEVVVTCTAGTISLYINGALIGTDAESGVLHPYVTEGHFGGLSTVASQSGWLYSLDGIIDDIGFWNKAFNATEVSTLYNSGTGQSITPEAVAPPVPTPIIKPPAEVATYKAVITGAPDSLPDFDLKISSFNSRLRSARNSYLSVVVPNARDIIDDIEARPNGELVLYQVLSDVNTELGRVNFQDLRPDEGASSGVTATISGYKQKTYSSPDGHEITTQSYYSRSGGKSRIRAPLIQGVEPADTILSNGITFIADTVILIGTPNRVYMEIAE